MDMRCDYGIIQMHDNATWLLHITTAARPPTQRPPYTLSNSASRSTTTPAFRQYVDGHVSALVTEAAPRTNARVPSLAVVMPSPSVPYLTTAQQKSGQTQPCFLPSPHAMYQAA